MKKLIKPCITLVLLLALIATTVPIPLPIPGPGNQKPSIETQGDNDELPNKDVENL